jgi:uncharacterized membrane protein
MLGVVLTVLSAATFAFNNASARRGVLTGSVAQGLAITVPLGVPLFLLATVATGNLALVTGFPADAVGALATAGVLHFVVGRYGNFRAAKAIGTNLSGPVIQLSLLITLALAIVVLKEQLTVLRIIGIALLVLGPAVMHEGSADAKPTEQGRFQPRYAEGYAFSLLAALAYGLSPILNRLAVIGGDLGKGLAGGLIAYSAATAVVLLVLAWPGQLRHALAITPTSLKWFTFSGVSVCIAQMLIYMAYAVAPISVVIPLLQLHLVLRLVLSRLLNPQHEQFGGGLVLGTALSVAGAVALALDVDLPAQLPLPEPLAGLARWRWP